MRLPSEAPSDFTCEEKSALFLQFYRIIKQICAFLCFKAYTNQWSHKMPLPRKITPERIRDAIVQLYFETEIPFEPLIGYFYAFLSEAGFSYTNRPVRPKHFLQQGTQALPNTFDIALVPQYFFSNEIIRFQVSDGSLVFNCTDTYPGWRLYFEQIQSVIGLLLEKQVVGSFKRVGLRYISEFPNIDILEQTNFTVELSGLNETITSGNFRVEWTKAQYRFIVNLATKFPIQPLVVEVEGKASFTSLIDIDVIQEGFSTNETEVLFPIIDGIHQQQKEQFFGLLKPDFLESLNPEY